MNELDFFKLAQKSWKPLSLVALVMVVFYGVARAILSLEIFSTLGEANTFQLLNNIFWGIFSIVVLLSIIFGVGSLLKKKDEKSWIQGKVCDINKVPVPGARVEVISREDGKQSAETDLSGDFRIPVRPQDSWMVQASYQNSRSEQIKVTQQDILQLLALTLPNETPPEPPPPPPPPDEDWKKKYMAYLIGLCKYPPNTALFDIAEAGIKDKKIELQKIYIGLDVLAQERLRGISDADRTALINFERHIPEEHRQPVLEAMSQAENNRLVLLGAPGSGKSTLVSYMTLCLAGDYLQRGDVNQGQLQEQKWGLSHLRLMPMLVTLRYYVTKAMATGQEDLLAYILETLKEANSAVSQTDFKQYLKEQGGILFLDGLDEVDNTISVRKLLKRQIEQFATLYPKVRMVVTSRPYAYSASWELTGFTVTGLLNFTPQQITTFIDQWYKVNGELDPHLGVEKAQEYAERLKKQVDPEVKHTLKLRELARNPLLLTMMVYIHRGYGGRELPKRREELYRLCIGLLIEMWQLSKDYRLSERLAMSGQELENALQEVAFEAHKAQPQTSDTAADIKGALLAGILNKQQGENGKVTINQIIEYVQDRAGLLQQHHTRNKDDAMDDDLYRFPHRTFQEYLAGQFLIRYEPEELARLSCEDPTRWREALLLAAASRRDTPFAIRGLIDELCPTLPPSSPVESSVWGGFLAGQVSIETDLFQPRQGGVLHKSEEVKRERVRQWQKKIVVDGLLPPAERAAAGDLLATLGDDRPGVLRCDDMQLCYVPAGEFWMADEPKSQKGSWLAFLDKPYWIAQTPVTVAQFREFVESEPYTPSFARSLSGPANSPVVWVNWYDALAFCNWLNKRWQPYLPEGYRVTLPNEAEWEKAARGGRHIPVSPHIETISGLKTTLVTPPATQANQKGGIDLSQREYPWGNEAEQEDHKRGLYRANSAGTGLNRVAAVGSFPQGASPVGCLDMAGNVWEWTRSFYDKKRPYQLSPEYETVNSYNKNPMWLWGGSFWDNYVGCSVRLRADPLNGINYYVGWRVVVSPFVSDR